MKRALQFQVLIKVIIFAKVPVSRIQINRTKANQPNARIVYPDYSGQLATYLLVAQTKFMV
jgi:hypothetical protein